MRGHSFINKCIFIIEIFPVFSLKIPFRCTSGLLLVKQEFFLSFLGAVSWPPSLSGPQTWPERKLLNVPNFTRNNVFDEHSSQPKRFDRSTSSFSSSLCTVNLSSRVRRRTFFPFFLAVQTQYSLPTTLLTWFGTLRLFSLPPKWKIRLKHHHFDIVKELQHSLWRHYQQGTERLFRGAMYIKWSGRWTSWSFRFLESWVT